MGHAPLSAQPREAFATDAAGSPPTGGTAALVGWEQCAVGLSGMWRPTDG